MMKGDVSFIIIRVVERESRVYSATAMDFRTMRRAVHTATSAFALKASDIPVLYHHSEYGALEILYQNAMRVRVDRSGPR